MAHNTTKSGYSELVVWIPAFAGMTALGTFYEAVIFNLLKIEMFPEL